MINKYFIEDHPRLLIDPDGDVYDTPDGRSKGKRIAELKSSTPATIEFDNSDEEAFNKQEHERQSKRWKDLAENRGQPIGETMRTVG